MEAGWRSGITRRMRPRRTTFGSAVKAQQSSATFKDQLRRVKARFRGAMRRKKGAFEKSYPPDSSDEANFLSSYPTVTLH